MMQPTLFEKKGIPLCPVCLGNRVKMGNGGALWAFASLLPLEDVGNCSVCHLIGVQL